MAPGDIQLVIDLPEHWKPPLAFYGALLDLIVDAHRREFPDEWDSHGAYLGPSGT